MKFMFLRMMQKGELRAIIKPAGGGATRTWYKIRNEDIRDL